ncbi:MAG: DUF4760 domain-containing protein [Bauldia sp.]
MPDPSVLPGAATQIASAAPAFWWVSPAVTAVAALIAAIIAMVSIYQNRKIARLRATLDLIERTESQEYYRDLVDHFKNVRDTNRFQELANTNDAEKIKEKTKILFFLNHYELLAIAFKRKILDRKFYSRWMRGTFVNDWLAAREFIEIVRNPPDKPSRPTVFCEMEALAKKWQRRT